MAHHDAERSPLVEIPTAAADSPSWGRVGVIAVLGFIVGVAWPRLAGIRMGPSLPDAPAASITAEGPMPSATSLSTPASASASVMPTPVAASSLPTTASIPSATPSQSAVASTVAAAAGPKTVQVVWDVALVRDSPRTGRVIARLPRGTELRVGPAKNGWYPVQYGDNYSSDGWLYRGAIGR